MQSNIIIKTILILIFVSLTTAQTSIVTGPIIGKVTTTTARVLIEFNVAAPITLILTDPTGQQFQSARNSLASIPIPFSFEGLQPNTRYTVTLNDSNITMTESYFTTPSGLSGTLNFAVTSCMDKGVQATKEDEADLWADLLRRIQNNEINYLLQTGDQVYMDDPFGDQSADKPYYNCMRIINSTPKEQWNDLRPQLIEFLRDEYRQTWNIPSVKETLAKIPSLTILDDHQVRDDWGYLATDYDPNSADYFYGTMARQVYYEYERQLREDIDFDNIAANYTQEFYYETINDIGFFFLDYRGIRTWNRNYSEMEDTQLGLVQTQLLQQVLDPVAGQFANLSNFFLISPLTVVFLVEKLTQLGFYGSNDAQESWSFAYSDEQTQLLNLLRDWKLAKPGREVTIIDGDVHMGGYTDVIYGDDFAYLQFTTSSMASSAPGEAAFLGFDTIKEAQNLQDPWTNEHHDWTNKFNYGIVIARYVEEEAQVGCYLVEASDDEEPEVIGSDGHSIDESNFEALIFQ